MRNLRASPRERALAGFAALLTESPWLVGNDDLDALAEVGLSDEGIVQVVCIASFFNYVTRVADATGIEYDYETPLARIQVDSARDALERPPRSNWPSPRGSPRLTLALRPATDAGVTRWRAYVFGSDEPISRRERALLGTVAASLACDIAGVEEHGDLRPENDRERALADYAIKLGLTPWRMGERDLAPLRALGFDDRGLLHIITTIAAQNVLSRLRLGLNDSR